MLTPLINALIWFLNLFFDDAPYVHFGDLITNFIGHRLFGGMTNLPTAGVDYHVPFGGTRKSSFGPREQGFAAVEFYTQVKTSYTWA